MSHDTLPSLTHHARYRCVRIISSLGRGRCVFEAEQELPLPGGGVHLRRVAIKEIRADDARFLDWYTTEVTALAAVAGVKHGAIPQLIDAFSAAPFWYIVMELVPGPTLGQLVADRREPVPLPRALDWICDLLDTLNLLHHRDPPLLHRDIKPANIKLPDPSRPRVVLLDFGIAKLGAETVFGGQGAGSQGFTAPEQERGEPTTPASDVYAVAATLHYLLTGKTPPSSGELRLAEHLRETSPLFAAVIPDLDQLLARALDANPLVRPQQAAAMLRELDAIRRRLPRHPLEVGRTVGGFEVEALLHWDGAPAAALARPAGDTAASPQILLYLPPGAKLSDAELALLLAQHSQLQTDRVPTLGGPLPDNEGQGQIYTLAYPGGEPLAPVAGDPTAADTVLGWCEQALDLLESAHRALGQQGLGLRPAAFELDREGRLVLLHLGPLQRRSQLPGDEHLYRAPELAEGGTPTIASDLYTLAATMLALLRGEPPSVMWMEQSVAPGPMPLERLLLGALAVDAAQRYPSLEALRRALGPLRLARSLRAALRRRNPDLPMVVTAGEPPPFMPAEPHPAPWETRAVLELVHTVADALRQLYVALPEADPRLQWSLDGPERIRVDAEGRVLLWVDLAADATEDGRLPSALNSATRPAPERDSYVLAMSAYLLLTGERFPRYSYRCEAVKDGDPDPLQPLSARNPRVPSGLDAVFARALALDPSCFLDPKLAPPRFRDAAAFDGALAPWRELYALRSMLADDPDGRKILFVPSPFSDGSSAPAKPTNFDLERLLSTLEPELRRAFEALEPLKPLPLAELVPLVRSLGNAIELLHTTGHFHGLLIDKVLRVGQAGDFLLLFEVGPRVPLDPKTMPYFPFAREQIQGQPVMDNDLFGLAAIAFFLLAAEWPPWPARYTSHDQFVAELGRRLQARFGLVAPPRATLDVFGRWFAPVLAERDKLPGRFARALIRALADDGL